MNKQKIKVLFLDIDGVVNCQTTSQRHRGFIGIDPYMAFLVGNMVDKLGLKVVLSSTWRLSADGREEVKKQVCDFIDCTPRLTTVRYQNNEGYVPRGEEIKKWLDEHPEVEQYAILDDDNDMLPEQQPNFFKTTWQSGINEDIIKAVTEHFTKHS